MSKLLLLLRRLPLLPVAVAAITLGVGAETRAAEGVQLTVRVIYAANSGKGVDGQLADLAPQLRNFSYTTYQLLGRHELFQPIGQSGTVSLPGGRQLQLTPQGITGGAVVLLASIQQEGQSLLNTQLKLANRGTILVGGPVHAGGVLILAVSAQLP